MEVKPAVLSDCPVGTAHYIQGSPVEINWLKRLRKNRNVTGYALAKSIQKLPSHIQWYENHWSPGYDFLVSVKRATSTSWKEIGELLEETYDSLPEDEAPSPKMPRTHARKRPVGKEK